VLYTELEDGINRKCEDGQEGSGSKWHGLFQVLF